MPWIMATDSGNERTYSNAYQKYGYSFLLIWRMKMPLFLIIYGVTMDFGLFRIVQINFGKIKSLKWIYVTADTKSASNSTKLKVELRRKYHSAAFRLLPINANMTLNTLSVDFVSMLITQLATHYELLQMLLCFYEILVNTIIYSFISTNTCQCFAG